MESILENKSFLFAKRMVNLNRYLTKECQEFVISKQVLRSGTSVGANISEAQFAQSKGDFVTKMHIALKEASETRFWIRLLEETEILDCKMSESLLKDCNELINLLVASLKTSKKEPL